MARMANGGGGKGRSAAVDVEGVIEGQKVYIPDEEKAWVPATVMQALGGSKFKVEVERTDNGKRSSKKPVYAGSIVVDASGPGFEGMDSLPLQNADTGDSQGVEDMCSLNHLHEPAILYNLRRRFMSRLPYTYTGEICIAINPYQWLDIYGKELGQRYKEASKRTDLSPHVYATSAQAFKGLQTYGVNQSILVSGESGAGKTETVKILLNHLADIAGSSADDRTIEKVITSNPLLESFGNAKTLRNDNSSRFGKFTELQMDARCRLSGSQSNTYLLEKVRVVSHARGERTYHIFYQLLAAPDAEKRHYRLDGQDSTSFRYTNMGGDQEGVIEGMSDGDRFRQTSAALDIIGMTEKETSELLSAVSGVLHLGQIEFLEKSNDSGAHGCEPSDAGKLEAPAEMLGVTAAELGQHLTHRTVKVEGKTIDVPLLPAAATDSLDGLAKEIYCRVFDWLVAKINDSMRCAPGGNKGTIDLLDIFGFETFQHNSFEQFCINYANEKLQQKFTQDVFKNVQVEYQEEGIPWSHIDFQDNAAVLGMIEEPRKGLLSLLDEECMLPQGTDEAYASKAVRAYKDHANFHRERFATKLEFTVHHYAGRVIYNTGGFVEKNKDQLQADLVEMLSASTNGVLGDCFKASAKAPAPQESGGANSRQRKGSLMQESLGSKFKRQLHALMAAIQRTEVQYVRCIKPNANKSKEELNCAMVVEQLRCAGVVEAIRISRAAYPNRMVFAEFSRRFAAMANKVVKGGGGSAKAREREAADFSRRPASSQCKYILEKLLGSKKDSKCCLGNSKVYFRAGVLEQLEEERGTFVRGKVVTVQRALMGNAKRRPFLRLRNAAIVGQKLWRGHVGRKTAARLKLEKEERERREREEEARRKKQEEEKRIYAEKKALEERRRKGEDDRKKAAKKAEKAAAGGSGLMGKLIGGGSGGGGGGSAKKEKSTTGGGREDYDVDSPAANGAAMVGIMPEFDSDDDLVYEKRKSGSSSATFSRFYSGNAGGMAGVVTGGGVGGEGGDESGKAVGRYNPLFHNAQKGGDKGEKNFGMRVSQGGRDEPPPGSPRTARRMHFLEFNPKALEGFMRVDMRGFLTQPVPRKGGTVKCFIRREKKELVRGFSKLIRGNEVYKLYMEGKGDFPDRYLMTARKKGGTSASQFVISMDDGDESEDSNVVGRLKATSRTSEEFQVFSPTVTGLDDKGNEIEKEVAAVHYSADKMDPHGRYEGPRKMRVVLGNMHGNNADKKTDSSLLHRMLRGNLDSLEEPCLVNRNPRWNAKVQAFVLNFHGRVTQASVKNFQLVVQGDVTEQITLQFGRTHTNEFTMDFCHPLSPLQALAITLTSFDCK
ncbi:unnamed protein product [Scytosiphon promiscuus]